MEALVVSSSGSMGPLLKKRSRREIMSAPMSSSLGAMGPLLRKLDSLLASDCIRFTKLLKNQVKRLRTDLLEDLISPLLELSKVQDPDLLAKYWMAEVRELSYDLEDSIHEITRTAHTNSCARNSIKENKSRAKIVGRYKVRHHAKIKGLPRMHNKRHSRISKVALLRTTLVWGAIERRQRYLPQFHDCRCRPAIDKKVTRLKIARLLKPPKQYTDIRKTASNRISEWEPSEKRERYQQINSYRPSSSHMYIGTQRLFGIDEPSEKHERYQQINSYRQSSSHMYIGAQRLFGIDEPRIELTKWLSDEKELNLKVVAVVGSGGSGKTTLVNEFYREFGGKFECRAFVRSSRKPNMRRLLWGILAQIQQHKLPSRACTVQDLIDNIRSRLQMKRYLIVVDNLWCTTIWDIIVNAFPDCRNCSRIITTTEMVDVALESCSFQSDNIFKMKSLGDDDSRKLFLSIIFGSEHRSDKLLEEVSYEITRTCNGLPLATVTAAGLVKNLLNQPHKTEIWSRIKHFMYLTLTTNPSPEMIMRQILNLSYNYLPQYLKTCLLYLSMYPEGYTIMKADLVKQWVAEGFTVATQGKDRKSIAESYFDELVNRKMICPTHIKYIDGVLSCIVHPIVLDIIKFQSKEENFTMVIDYPQITTGVSTKVRRVCLQLNSAKHATTKQAYSTMSHVRSLAFFGVSECVPSIAVFKLLRVLVIEIWGEHNGSRRVDLKEIGTLVYLRYLKITSDVNVELPDKIAMLQDLETLEVNAKVIVVPSDIIDLSRLVQLRIRDEINLPKGIGSIRSLCTLQYFDLAKNSEENVKSLGQLTNLRELHLTSSIAPSVDHQRRNLAALSSCLGKLSNLNSLILAPGASGVGRISLEGSSVIPSPPLSLERLELLPPVCIFSRLPRWIGEFRRLRVLKIVVRELFKNDMDSISSFPALVVLSLQIQVARMGTVIIKPTSFPVLRYLRFRCGVLSLAFRAGAMPNLQRLKLGFTAQKGKRYRRMLAGVENLLNLEEITGQISAASDADESDLRTAESAFSDDIEALRQKWNAMDEHPRFPTVRMKWEHEEADAFQQEVGSAGGTTTVKRDGGCNMLCFPVELLPGVISFTSPLDACRCFAVCTAFHEAAKSDEVWDSFFPPDYRSIISRAIDPVDFSFASTQKELFISLAEEPILIDQGYTSFWLDKTTGTKSYMLASRSLCITWAHTPDYWRWILHRNSRFGEVAKLEAVCWLDIMATTDCRELSSNIRYTAYLVFDLTEDYYGLERQEASITVAGSTAARHSVSFHPRKQQTTRGARSRGKRLDSQEHGLMEETIRYPRARRDGWMEVELGDFYNGNLDDGSIEIRIKEHERLHWKSGLIIEGVEIRPKVGNEIQDK